ncbi:unnamed protein product [Toxocara canis]|uniref:Uncharacterized protein n=1 Tax=Toxocara canis TaxID=6265 RepID=A0A183VDS4_TOXCA|nr:unnamed protein product [Toxocara canis]
MRYADFYRRAVVEERTPKENFIIQTTTQQTNRLMEMQSQIKLNVRKNDTISTEDSSSDSSVLDLRLQHSSMQASQVDMNLENDVEVQQGTTVIHQTSQPFSTTNAFETDRLVTQTTTVKPLKMTNDREIPAPETLFPFRHVVTETEPGSIRWTIGSGQSEALSQNPVIPTYRESTVTQLATTEEKYDNHSVGSRNELTATGNIETGGSNRTCKTISQKQHLSTTSAHYSPHPSALFDSYEQRVHYSVEQMPAKISSMSNGREKIARRVKRPSPNMRVKKKTKICKDSHQVTNYFC